MARHSRPLANFEAEHSRKQLPHAISHPRGARVDEPRNLTIIMVTMSAARPFKLIYAPAVRGHLRAIERKYYSVIRSEKYYSVIRSEIASRLRLDPDVEAINRKPLKRPFMGEGTWEIRFGPQNRFRVFYEVNRRENEVWILAIGVKVRDRSFIGGKEVKL